MKRLSNSELTIEVAAHGAELCSIKCRGKEYLWQADPKFWGRHSPVLFPIVGSVWENEYRYRGATYTLTQHGFARDMEFQLFSESDREVWYRLTDNDETRKKYPFPFCLEIGYRIEGRRIEVTWRVKNTGNDTMHFQIGAHPAFYFPDFDPSTTCRGYFGFERAEGLRYTALAEKGCVDTSRDYPLPLQDGMLPLDTHTFDIDTFVIEHSQVREVTLYDKEKQPHLRVRFTAPVVGLWSPPRKNAPFVCIEPWYGRCDRAHYNGEYQDRDWVQHLPSGEEFQAGYTIEIA